jgi:hypothetical protein
MKNQGPLWRRIVRVFFVETLCGLRPSRAALADGDRHLSVGEFRAKYRAGVYRLSLRLVKDPEQAQAITDRTFAAVSDRGDRPSRFTTRAGRLHQAIIGAFLEHCRERDRLR